jgi:hypothetical protein
VAYLLTARQDIGPGARPPWNASWDPRGCCRIAQ